MLTTTPDGELQLGALFNAAPNAYVVFDLDLTIVGCNECYLHTTGRTREEIIGRPLFDAFPSDPASTGGSLLRGSLAKVLAEKRADEIALLPYDVSRPDQVPETRYWSATHTPIFDEDGTFRYILQHTSDVTAIERLRQSARANQQEVRILQRAAKVQVEKELLARQSEQLRRMLEQSPSFMAVVDGPDHVITLVNQAYSRLVGSDREVLGKPVAEAIPEVVEQGFVKLLDQVRERGEAYVGRGVPVSIRSDAGGPAEQTYLDFIHQPIRDADGKVHGIFIQGHDITEQKRAEQALLEQREMLRLAQEAGGIGTFVWDFATGKLDGSNIFDAMHGYGDSSTPRDYADYLKVIHPDDRQRWMIQFAEDMVSIAPIEYRVELPGGDLRWIERFGTVLRSQDGRRVIAVGAGFDITERKARETEMALIAEESAHRVNNLLTMVQVIVSQTMRRSRDLPEAQARIGERLAALSKAQDMLVRRGKAGGGLRDLIRKTINPHISDESRVWIDGPNLVLDSRSTLAFSLAVHELATNALKYGALGVPEGRVVIRWRQDDEGGVDWSWEEVGGPPVTQPDRKGFGSVLIEKSWPSDTVAKIDYAPTGLVCRIRLRTDRSAME